MHVHKETIYNNITFRKFISDNIILFGMTVTFCSKTFRLSVMLLKKQNNKANIKTRERKENNKLSNELQATCTNYSVKDTLSLQDTRGSIKWLQNLLFHHVLIIKLQAIKDKQTDTGIFESRFLQTQIQEREGLLIISHRGIFSYHQTHL